MEAKDSLWVKVGVVATVLGTVLTYISIAAAQHWLPFNPSGSTSRPTASPTLSSSTSPPPSPQVLTVGKVKAALLMPSDLNSIDANLSAQDLSTSGGCNKNTVNHTIDVARLFKDGGALALFELIKVFGSSGDAHIALKEDAQQFTCAITTVRSSSNISDKLSGLCDEGVATAIIDKDILGANTSEQIGEVRCGRILVLFAVDTAEGSSWDSSDNLVTGLKAAILNVKNLA